MRALMLYHFLAARWRWRTLRGEALARFQESRARGLVRWVAEHSAFYRAHWQGWRLDDWQTLPTVDKLAMMANFDSFNTAGVSKDEAMRVALQAEHSRDFSPTVGGCTVGLSSGTSGHRGLFLVSAAERAMWAGVILARTLPALKRTRVAFFLRSNSNLYETVGDGLIRFRYFDLMTPLDEAVAALNDYQPTIVVGPPSLLGALGARPHLRIRPDRLISTAEVLEPQDRARLRVRFGAPVHEVYQATEGLLGVSCERGRLHAQEDVAVLQGEEGGAGIVVTDLWRRTQPIVRYRLNDVVRFASAPCECGSGFRVIEAVEGRSDDVLQFGPVAVFPDAVRKMILLASDEIVEYEAVQDAPGHLRVGLEVRPGTDEGAVETAVRESVGRVLSQHGCAATEVEIGFTVAAAPNGAKRRRVRNGWRQSGGGGRGGSQAACQ